MTRSSDWKASGAIELVVGRIASIAPGGRFRTTCPLKLTAALPALNETTIDFGG